MIFHIFKIFSKVIVLLLSSLEISIVKSRFTSHLYITEAELEKLSSVISDIFGVPEASVWFSDYEFRPKMGHVKHFFLNIYCANEIETRKLLVALKSNTLLNTLNERCKKDVFSFSGDKFDHIKEPVREIIKGIKISIIIIHFI